MTICKDECGCSVESGFARAAFYRCPLHAAAPDLLAACKLALAKLTENVLDCWCMGLDGWEYDNPNNPVCLPCIVRAAIAKAEEK